MADPPTQEANYRNSSSYAIGLLKDMRTDIMATEWDIDNVRRVRWISEYADIVESEQIRIRCSQCTARSAQYRGRKEVRTSNHYKKIQGPSDKSYCTFEEAVKLYVAIHGSPQDRLHPMVDVETQRGNLFVCLHLQASPDELEGQITPGLAEALYDVCFAV